jgi:hypothetical protein
VSGFWTAVILLAVAAIVAAVVLGAVSSRRRFDEPSERVRPGGDTYPTGSRPAGPGAEGMRVDDPGEITPGPGHPPDEGNRSG